MSSKELDHKTIRKTQIIENLLSGMTTSFDMKNVATNFLKTIVEGISAGEGSLLLKRDQKLFFFANYRGPKNIVGKEIKIGMGLSGIAAKKRSIVVSNDIKNDKRWLELIKDENYHPINLVAAPIIIDGRLVGVIELMNKKDGFNEDDIEIIKSVIPVFGFEIERMRLYDINQRELDKLKALIDISLQFGGMLDLQTLLEKIMEIARETLNAEASSIFLIDEEKKDLYFIAATGEKKESLREIRVPWGKGVAGWVAAHGETLYVPDVSKDPRFYSGVDKKTKFITKSIIAVPLRRKNRIVGVSEVLNKRGGEHFSEEDITLFEAIAKQASVAIENASLYKELEILFRNTIRLIVNAIEAKDPYTKGHTARVTSYSTLIAKTLKLSPDERNALELAALLHDVGKIGIPDSILLKPGKLSKKEYAVIKQHPVRGAKIMEPLNKPLVIQGILHHHEKYDGSGYPAGLKGRKIPIISKIITVADAFDAMTTDRPYRKRLSLTEAVRRLKKDAGTHFDPNIVEAFLDVIEVKQDRIKEIIGEQDKLKTIF